MPSSPGVTSMLCGGNRSGTTQPNHRCRTPTISLDAEDDLLVLFLQIVDKFEGIIHIVFAYERHFL
jgi:hypothetical protein